MTDILRNVSQRYELGATGRRHLLKWRRCQLHLTLIGEVQMLNATGAEEILKEYI